MTVETDRNLLFGLLALQNGFIDSSALIAAFQAWTCDKAQPLAQYLQERGDLALPCRALLDALAEEHVRQHGCDPRRSLATLSTTDGVSPALWTIEDEDLQASLVHIGAARRGYDNPLAAPVSSLAISEPTTSVAGVSGTAGRFRILRPHAKGGLGTVVVALDSELNREVAFKQIQDRYADHPESRARFVLEAEITGGLEHPSIVPVYSLGHDPSGRPFYAMRFIKGNSLKQSVERFHENGDGRGPGGETLELQKLLRRFLDVCNAIAYAHSRGVLHRDIKPGNVIVGQYGETLVVDWGLAKVVGTDSGDSAEATLRPPSANGSCDTLPGSAMGTPQFMSPEQAAGRIEALGPASDVYSLGATLYYVLTGKPPFSGSDVGEILRSVQSGEFAPPRRIKADVPRPLEAICFKAMAVVPENRYATPREMADDIELWLADEPVSAWSEPVTIVLRRWLRKHRALTTAAAAVLVVGLLALGIGLARESILSAKLAKALDEANKAHMVADRRLDQTLAAIKDYYTGVGEEILFDVDQFKPLREKLLAKPREFYERFAAEVEVSGAKDERSRRLLAEGRASLGRVLMLTGKAAEAREQCSGAVTTLRDLHVLHPDSLELTELLASTIGQFGLLLNSLQHYQAALGAHREALGLYRGLAEKLPDVPAHAAGLVDNTVSVAALLKTAQDYRGAEGSYREALALCDRWPRVPTNLFKKAIAQNGLGGALAGSGDAAKAIEAYRQAVGLCEVLVAADASVAHLLLLSLSCQDLGNLLKRTGDVTSALKAYRQSMKARDSLASSYPNVPLFQEYMGTSAFELGVFLKSTGDAGGAIEAYRDSVRRRQALVAAYHENAVYTKGLASSLNNLANLLRARGDKAEAAELHRTAMKYREELIAKFPENVEYREELAQSGNNLGSALRGLGETAAALIAYQRAVDLYTELAKRNPNSASYRQGLSISKRNLESLKRQGSSKTPTNRGEIEHRPVTAKP